MKRILLLTIFFIFLCSQAWPANYFVAPTVTGAEDGSTVIDAATVATCNGVDHDDSTVIIFKSEVEYTTELTLAGITSGAGKGDSITVRGSVVGDGDWGDGTKTYLTKPPFWDYDNTQDMISITDTDVSNLTIKDLYAQGSHTTAEAPTLGSRMACVYFNGITGLEIDNFDANNIGPSDALNQSSTSAFIHLRNVKGAIEVKNCAIDDVGSATNPDQTDLCDWYCLWVINDFGESMPSSVLIHDNSFTNAEGDPLHTNYIVGSSGDNVLKIYDNTIGNGGENCLDIKSCRYFEVYGNHFYRDGFDWGGYPQASQYIEEHIVTHAASANKGNSTYGYIYNNYFDQNNGSAGEYAGAIDLGADHYYIYNNYFKDCPGTISGNASNVEIYNNVFFFSENPTYITDLVSGGSTTADDHSWYAVAIYMGLSNQTTWIIQNNSFYSNVDDIAKFIQHSYQAPGTGVTILNNAFQLNTLDSNSNVMSVITGTANVICNNNTYYNSHGSAPDQRLYWGSTQYTSANWSTWQAAHTNSDWEDPGFDDEANGDLTTSSGSNIVDDGTTGATQGLKDTSSWASGPTITINAVMRADHGTNPDKGAYEFVSTGEDPPIGNNDVSQDNNCILQCNFESGALTTDSKSGTIISTGNAADEDTTNYRQGLCSAHFESDNSDYYYITNANLNIGTTFTFVAWLRPTDTGVADVWIGKYNYTDNKRSFRSVLNGSNYVVLTLGFNNGISYEELTHPTAITRDSSTWTLVAVSYNNTDKSYAIRQRDVNGNILGSDYTGTATLDANKLSDTDARLDIGCQNSGATPGSYYDGNKDELFYFDKVLTADDVTNLSLGKYGEPAISVQSATATAGTVTATGDHSITLVWDRETYTTIGVNGPWYVWLNVYDGVNYAKYEYVSKSGVNTTLTASLTERMRSTASGAQTQLDFKAGETSIICPDGTTITDAQDQAATLTGLDALDIDNVTYIAVPGIFTLGTSGLFPLWSNGSTGFHDILHDEDKDKFDVLNPFADDFAISADNVRIRGTGGNVAITGGIELLGACTGTIIKCLTFSGGITDNGNDYVYQEHCRGGIVD